MDSVRCAQSQTFVDVASVFDDPLRKAMMDGAVIILTRSHTDELTMLMLSSA